LKEGDEIMLVSYRGIVKDGKVEIAGTPLPDGYEVVVVTQSPPNGVETPPQEMSDAEWRRPFEQYLKVLRENPAEVDVMTLSDAELNDLIHEERRSKPK
jgi:hypothetical protein